MNKYASREIKQLIEEIARKTKEDLILTGFRAMELKIGKSVGEKFLYKKYNEINKKPDGEISIQRSRLDDMLAFLGFANLQAFQQAMANPIPEVLQSCEGNWVSYVRQNSEKGIIYQSPVRIFEQQGRMMFMLSGPHQSYTGEMTFSNGVVFTLFVGENGKQFHHVYRIGQRMNPRVLQGVFSGVSTEGNPIGGRTALIKSDRNFEDLVNGQVRITELESSTDSIKVSIAKYFKKYADNNLSINRVVTFDIDDLG